MLGGIQTLLGLLSPCTQASIKTTCKGFDQVSLWTFPNVVASTAQNDYTCPTSKPTVANYYTPAVPTSSTTTWIPPSGSSPTYEITGYLDDYSSTNQAGGALNQWSALSIAAGAASSSNCKGLQTDGVDTFFAGAIYAAQTSLLAEQSANPGSANSMIILSDGAANSTHITNAQHAGNTYPSADDQCHQAITAAQLATAQGTKVITIAYGASSTSSLCTTDKGSLADYAVRHCETNGKHARGFFLGHGCNTE